MKQTKTIVAACRLHQQFSPRRHPIAARAQLTHLFAAPFLIRIYCAVFVADPILPIINKTIYKSVYTILRNPETVPQQQQDLQKGGKSRSYDHPAVSHLLSTEPSYFFSSLLFYRNMSTIRARIDARKKRRRRIRRHHLISSSFHSIMFASSRQKNGGILLFFSNNTTNVGGEQSFLVGRKMGVESNSLQKHLRHLGGVPEIRHRSSWPTSSCSSAGRKGNTRR